MSPGRLGGVWGRALASVRTGKESAKTIGNNQTALRGVASLRAESSERLAEPGTGLRPIIGVFSMWKLCCGGPPSPLRGVVSLLRGVALFDDVSDRCDSPGERSSPARRALQVFQQTKKATQQQSNLTQIHVGSRAPNLSESRGVLLPQRGDGFAGAAQRGIVGLVERRKRVERRLLNHHF